LRRLACVAVLTLAAACGAPEGAQTESPAANPPDAPNTARTAPGEVRAYAGEWAPVVEQCGDSTRVWTIETNRMGMRRERFCVFDRVYASTRGGEDEAWSASARCLADGRESQDFVFFRLKANRAEMRVTINDADSVDLVRCPMRT
jgi:hypothetical protein